MIPENVCTVWSENGFQKDNPTFVGLQTHFLYSENIFKWNTWLLEGLNVYMLREIGCRISDRMSMCNSLPLLLLFTAVCLSRDHVTVTCIFAYIFFKFQGYKNGEVQNQDEIFLSLFYSLNFSPYSVIYGYLNLSCSAM